MSSRLRDPMQDLAAFSEGQDDTVWLCLPRGPAVVSTVRVLLGGVASQQSMPLDRLDDLQLAVEMLVKEDLQAHGQDLVLLIRADQDAVCVRIDGLTNERLKRALQADASALEEQASPLNVRMIVSSLVDRYDVFDSGEFFTVEMTKRTQ
ncbi:MAG: hypothetical protein N3B14_05575 [Thermoleophilia bacterium]|nr:hypothetical protein [Thermoleophilia bacterium]